MHTLFSKTQYVEIIQQTDTRCKIQTEITQSKHFTVILKMMLTFFNVPKNIEGV